MRAVLIGLAEEVMPPARRGAALLYLEHLDLGIGRSDFDDLDQLVARQEDRQGLGLSRKPRPAAAAPAPVTLGGARSGAPVRTLKKDDGK